MGYPALDLITIFVLSVFVGFEVIAKVSSLLHTPLMSGANAIHGVILIGAMTVLSEAHGAIQLTLGFIATVLATVNVVGGFVVTDRMLEMFKGRGSAAVTALERAASGSAAPSGSATAHADGGRPSSTELSSGSGTDPSGAPGADGTPA